MSTQTESLADSLKVNVRRLREQRGFSQSELATKAGVSRAAVARLEGGRSGPRSATIDALARALEVDVAELLRERRKESRRAS